MKFDAGKCLNDYLSWAGPLTYLLTRIFDRSSDFHEISPLSLQEQAKLDANKQATSPDDCEDLSPMPPTSQPPVRRRGAFSAEPVTEEDATSYVKKVRNPL